MPRSRERNQVLQALINEAGLSHKGLARRVIDLAASKGNTGLRYDHSSVHRWLQGQRPRPPVPELIGEVLSARLGRQVTVADIGMEAPRVPDDAGLRLPTTPVASVEAVAVLTRGDLDQRRVLWEAGFDPAAHASAALRWLLASRSGLPVTRGQRNVGLVKVEEIGEATQAFRVLDNRLGGGRIRPTVVEYLHSDVVPLLHNARCAEQVRCRLFATAAELTQLAGWQAYDLEMHGLAQRYMVQALGMASLAGADGLGGEILAAMSHQAVYVARVDNAIDAAQAAQAAARRAGLAVLLTECLVTEAHGHALRRDARACAQALKRAEVAFTTAADDDLPVWLSYFDEAYFAAKIAHCFRALGQGAQTERYARRSLEMDQRYVRGKAFNTATLAAGHALQGQVEEACHHGREAVDLTATLHSARAISYIRDLFTHLSPYSSAPLVRDLTAYARQRLPALPARAARR